MVCLQREEADAARLGDLAGDLQRESRLAVTGTGRDNHDVPETRMHRVVQLAQAVADIIFVLALGLALHVVREQLRCVVDLEAALAGGELADVLKQRAILVCIRCVQQLLRQIPHAALGRLVLHDRGVGFPVGSGRCDLKQLQQIVAIVLPDSGADRHAVDGLAMDVHIAHGGEDQPVRVESEIILAHRVDHVGQDALVLQHRAEQRLLGAQASLAHQYTPSLTSSQAGASRCAGRLAVASSQRRPLRKVEAYGMPTPSRHAGEALRTCSARPMVSISASSGLSLSQARTAPMRFSPRG